MISYHTDTVTVVRAPVVKDPYDNDVFDWPNATSTPVTGCRVQPEHGSSRAGGGVEYVIDREAITTKWRLFGPAGMDLLATDRVQHQGATYAVDGSVERWPSPTGRLAHVEARLTLTEG